MIKSIGVIVVTIGTWLLVSMPIESNAEVTEIRVARTVGIGDLPFMVMQDRHLIEKHAKRVGLSDLNVSAPAAGSGAVVIDALLSGATQYAIMGTPPLITVWEKTVGTPQEIKGVASLTYFPLYLLTREGRIKSIADFTSQDKIAMPAAKVGNQALILQMAAAKMFGIKAFDKLDAMTVSMSLPTAMVALLSGGSEVNAHFSTPPFQFEELNHPEIRKILDSQEVFGGPLSTLILVANKKFRDENPKAYQAFMNAVDEAMAIINADKKNAAEVYIKASNSKASVTHILEILNYPGMKFTTTPAGTFKAADFMYKVGRIKKMPSSWKDLFFPELHHLPGS